jgi:hypothetical protein
MTRIYADEERADNHGLHGLEENGAAPGAQTRRTRDRRSLHLPIRVYSRLPRRSLAKAGGFADVSKIFAQRDEQEHQNLPTKYTEGQESKLLRYQIWGARTHPRPPSGGTVPWRALKATFAVAGSPHSKGDAQAFDLHSQRREPCA